MVIVDTSAWIEYLGGGVPAIVDKVDLCLGQDLVGIGDLIYCEVMQGIRSPRERRTVSTLLLSLPQFEMVGFSLADKSAANYRLLRSRGITVRKTIDVMIGTFCAEHGLQLLHNDSDFDLFSHYALSFGVLFRPVPSSAPTARRPAPPPGPAARVARAGSPACHRDPVSLGKSWPPAR